MGRYQQEYHRSLTAAGSVLAGRGRADRLVHRAHGGAGPLGSSVLPVVHRRGAEHVLQRGGPACPRWPGGPAGADLRQPGDRLAAGDDVPGAAGGGGAVRRRPDGPGRDRGGAGGHLYADGARGRGGDAGVCPDRRGSLGGVRRVRRGRARDADRGRQAGGGRDGVLWHRGEPGGGVQADPGPGDRAVTRTSRARAWCCSGRRRGRRSPPGGTSTGRSRWRRRSPRAASRSPRPIRSTSCTRRAPPGSPRASSATTAGMPSRWPGACSTSTTPSPGTCTGPPPTSGGWSGTPTSCTRRCWPGAPRSCTRASRWGRRTRGPSGGSSRSTGSRPCSPPRPRSG